MISRVFASVQRGVNRLLCSPTAATIVIVSLAAGFVYLCSHIEPPSLHAATALQQPKSIDAPELVGGTDWFNTDAPIKLADLRGRIVLIDFWTLCCINCIHTLPDLATLEGALSRRARRHRRAFSQVREREKHRQHPEGDQPLRDQASRHQRRRPQAVGHVRHRPLADVDPDRSRRQGARHRQGRGTSRRRPIGRSKR